MALCLCFAAVTVSADVVWSSAFDFDGSEIVEPSGTVNKQLGVIAYPEGGLDGREIFFTDDPNDEGTFSWNYINNPSFVENSNYTLKETIISYDAPDVTYTRVVHILPEPAVFVLLGVVAAFFLRRRAKSILIVLALVSLGSISAKATTVSVGKCFQMWPFERKVIINYTISDCSQEEYINFYYTTDNGESSYDLREHGSLTGDIGPISANGNYRVIWTPDTSDMASVKGKMKIGVDVYEEEPPEPPTPTTYTYMVVDLSEGHEAASYPVTYTDEIPEGGWNVDEYKTSKMVFRLVPAGTFSMGSPSGEKGHNSTEIQHTVTLTKPYYIGIFEVTQRQYVNITGNNPVEFSKTIWPDSPKYPVENVSFADIRGSDQGSNWTAGGHNVDMGSFLKTLRSRTGDLAFDLPTEAQWEYACRANTTTSLNSGENVVNLDEADANTDEVAVYAQNSGSEKAVGGRLPNSWGLYDMHGNVSEFVLDWYANYTGDETDPKGPVTGTTHVTRGGDFEMEAEYCRSAARLGSDGTAKNRIGFRIILELD